MKHVNVYKTKFKPRLKLEMLNILEEDPSINKSELSRRLKISRPTTYKYLKEVENQVRKINDANESKISEKIGNFRVILQSYLGRLGIKT